VRKLLIEKVGYSDEELPGNETIRVKLNDLGYSLKRVAKIQPKKKSTNGCNLRANNYS